MDKLVDLSWAAARAVVGGTADDDWWWREYYLGIHNDEPLSVGFVADNRFAYAMYLGSDVLLYHPTIAEAEHLLAIFQGNTAREATRNERV